jgi:3-phosphoshikimate 1-carboxyvinyltransferase
VVPGGPRTVSPAREIARPRSLRGSLRVPGDKSASHRALMISALADGPSSIEGLSAGRDVASTSAIMQQLGATRRDDSRVVTIVGPSGGLRPSEDDLDCGNSGTTMRLLSGIVSGIEGEHTLVGDPSLSRRPMDRVAVPLTLMGAIVSGRGDRVTAPLRIRGTRSLQAIDYHVPIASAQVKSTILFAALGASGRTTVYEDIRTRSTTEDMFRQAGLDVRSVARGDGRRVTIEPGRPRATQWRIPGDPSQAAFFAVLGVVHDDAALEVLGVDSAPERVGFVAVLQRMGAALSFEPRPGGAALVSRSSSLVATDVDAHEIPSVDEVPILAVAAAAASGVSAFRDMAELRVKESDRFAGSMALARSLGCRVWDEGDDFFIEGLGGARKFRHFSLDARLDHRMVMAGAVAGCAGQGCVIGGAQTITSSYPGFFDDLASLQ